MTRFAYYRRLSKQQKRAYRLSDEYGSVELDAPEALRPTALLLGEALRADDQAEVERTSDKLTRDLCLMLNVEPPKVRVRAARPTDAYGELHGLYTPAEQNIARIEVWMRTAALGRVVAHRTFLRTLMHEVGHHLDYELLELEESFHTAGFFERESSLTRQILPKLQVLTQPPPAELQLQLDFKPFPSAGRTTVA